MIGRDHGRLFVHDEMESVLAVRLDEERPAAHVLDPQQQDVDVSDLDGAGVVQSKAGKWKVVLGENGIPPPPLHDVMDVFSGHGQFAYRPPVKSLSSRAGGFRAIAATSFDPDGYSSDQDCADLESKHRLDKKILLRLIG